MNDSVIYVMKVFPHTSSSHSQRYRQKIILNIKYIVPIVVYLALGYLANVVQFLYLHLQHMLICCVNKYGVSQLCRVYYHVERNSFTSTSAVSWTQGSVTFVKDFEIFFFFKSFYHLHLQLP